MTNNTQPQQPIFGALGAIGLVADLISILAFVLTGTALQFWSAHWVIGLIFIAALLVISLSLLKSSNQPNLTGFLPSISVVYGVLFGLAFAATFVTFSTTKEPSAQVFFGLFALTLFPACMSLYVGLSSDKTYLKNVGYLTIIVTLLCLLGLFIKYIFIRSDITVGKLFGELFLLIYSATWFATYNACSKP